MTAVATRPVELTTVRPYRRVLAHGVITILAANALLGAAILVMVRQFSDVVSPAWFGVVALTTLVDACFITATRIQIGDGQVIVRCLLRTRRFDRGAVLLRPARFGRASVLVPLGRPVRPLARFGPDSRTLAELLDARVAIVRN